MNGADDLMRAARKVLDTNWVGTHTLPATGLYPHQWSWDSAFIAMGLRHVDPTRARQELESLFAAQWADGRVPQIVYDVTRDDDYSPGAAFWQSNQIPAAPDVPTTGLVQPPNHAWAVWEIHKADPEASTTSKFLRRLYPKLRAWHDYLAERRDRGGRGLASIVHPWESGMDNSPLWDAALRRVPDTPRHPILRPDLQHADSTERPSAKEYGRYFWLAEQYRDQQCDDASDSSFLMEDPAFNALWARSEMALAEIATAIGTDPRPHQDRVAVMTQAVEDLYDEHLGLFVARDVLEGSLVSKATISGVVPLILPDLPRAASVLQTVMGPRFLQSEPLMVPSYDVLAKDFEPSQYWRGPAWFNMTWLVILGLRTYGAGAEAERLAGNMRHLAHQHGFPEYVDPWTGSPHGTRDFSWTAALALDLLSTPYHRASMRPKSPLPAH